MEGFARQAAQFRQASGRVTGTEVVRFALHKARLGFKNYTTQRKKKSLTSVQFTRGVLEQLTSAQIAVGVRVVANLRVAPATNDSIKDQVSRK
jgi:hypothetical protein